MQTMDIHEVMRHLPHRYPFLLIDKVLEYECEKYLVGVKNVSINEPFFQGHFPQRPVMPGVLILEALAQATGVLAFRTAGQRPGLDALYYFVGIDKARFKQPVEPGDQLILRADFVRKVRAVWKFTTEATVDGKVVATADMMCAEKRLDD